MKGIGLVAAALVISASAGCASKSETRQDVEATEETAGDETRSSRYRRLEGSTAYSSEEAAAQMGGY